jgi:hypothetical protein
VRSRPFNLFELTSILSIALGIPVMTVSRHLLRVGSIESAIPSIILGNLVLWFIGFAILCMCDKNSNAIENISAYFGKTVSKIASVI